MDTLATAGSAMPKNVLSRHYLDCAVINHLHDLVTEAGEQSFDTVRALFPQGKRIYRTAGFMRQTHVQISVRNPDNIKGIFRVRP